jgi:hypothetical protein
MAQDCRELGSRLACLPPRNKKSCLSIIRAEGLLVDKGALELLWVHHFPGPPRREMRVSMTWKTLFRPILERKHCAQLALHLNPDVCWMG